MSVAAAAAQDADRRLRTNACACVRAREEGGLAGARRVGSGPCRYAGIARDDSHRAPPASALWRPFFTVISAQIKRQYVNPRFCVVIIVYNGCFGITRNSIGIV